MELGPKAQPNKDKENFAQVDGTFDLNWGAISSLKTGLRVADHALFEAHLRADLERCLKGDFLDAPVATNSVFSGTVDVGGWTVRNQILSRRC